MVHLPNGLVGGPLSGFVPRGVLVECSARAVRMCGVEVHLGASRRISAHLDASRRISVHLDASRRISANLGASRCRPEEMRGAAAPSAVNLGESSTDSPRDDCDANETATYREFRADDSTDALDLV